MSHTAPGQLASPLPEGPGARGLLLSASKEIEPGARAMILLADGLFRLDVALLGDTLRTIVRNLSSGQLDLEDGLHPETDPHLVVGDVAAFQPGQGRVNFALGAGDDRVSVDVTLGMLRYPERGTARITAQAIVRQAPAA
ncbi:MAG: hypothetical protein ACJ764_14845 [Solirubrobacteraceae bacterium]